MPMGSTHYQKTSDYGHSPLKSRAYVVLLDRTSFRYRLNMSSSCLYTSFRAELKSCILHYDVKTAHTLSWLLNQGMSSLSWRIFRCFLSSSIMIHAAREAIRYHKSSLIHKPKPFGRSKHRTMKQMPNGMSTTSFLNSASVKSANSS